MPIQRKSIHLLNELFDLLPEVKNENEPIEQIIHNFDGDEILLTADRYYVLKKSASCCFCGITGSFFAKEKHVKKDGSPTRNSRTNYYHLNMYAIDKNGKEVLMTKDHIIPKAKGGLNLLSNYQTACSKCNEKKGKMDDKKFKLLIEKGDI